MKLLNDANREALKGYPLYSQDGKKGDAIAVIRIFITGTEATYYVLEADLDNGCFFGVYKTLEGWEYGYFYLDELESLELDRGLIHAEVDTTFTPTPLKEIKEVGGNILELWNEQ